MATDRELIAKVLELKDALDRLDTAEVQGKRLDAAYERALAEQIQGQNEIQQARFRVGEIRAELKGML